MKPFPFAMTPFRPSADYLILKTSTFWILYIATIPPVFIIDPRLIILNLLLLITFFYRFLSLGAELYVISPDMIMVSTGLIGKTVRWIDPLQVSEFKVQQPGLMAFLNMTDLALVCDDDPDANLVLRGIDLQAVREALLQSLNLLKERRAMMGQPLKPAGKCDLLHDFWPN